MNTPQITDISWQILQQNDQQLPPRAMDSHKGDHGHVLLVGGDHGYAGAALMASQAALISGAGLVSCTTRPEHISAYITRCPEVMVSGINSGLELAPHLDKQKLLVLGPGLGKQAFGQLLLQTVLQYLEQAQNSQALVLDADGLNLLAEKPLITGQGVNFSKHAIIMTPHPAEAARLLGISTAEVQADRPAAIMALVNKYNCTVILKGQHSLVAGKASSLDRDIKIYRCLDGNPGMASGGMGDILSGICGAILAQFLNLGLSPLAAAKLACCAHSKAADNAAQAEGEVGLLATDLLPYIRQLLQVSDEAIEMNAVEITGIEIEGDQHD